MTKKALKELREKAARVLKANDTGRFTKPAPRLYPHQWNWDSAFTAIGWSHIDEARARQEIRSLFRGQWKNGMIPHIIFDPEAVTYYPGPAYWRIPEQGVIDPGIRTSGITQPPFLASAAHRIFQNSKNKEEAEAFLREIYPGLKSFCAYFLTHRDPENEGLACTVHPWETGTDDSIGWDAILKRMTVMHKPEYSRVDTAIVDADQRPTDDEYDRYTLLVENLRNADYEMSRLWRKHSFLVQPVLLNSLLAAGLDDLAIIASVIGEDTELIDHGSGRIKEGIENKLYDSERGIYLDYDAVSDRSIPNETIHGYAPMFAGCPSRKGAVTMVKRLFSSKYFFPEKGYPLCSVSMTDPAFNPRRYWRGPVWINMNWLVIEGLKRYGFTGESNLLTNRTLDLVNTHGFFEYFDPKTGQGYGTDHFSWTAALVIDLIQKKLGGSSHMEGEEA